MQIYDNHEEMNTNMNKDTTEGYIDIYAIMEEMWMELVRHLELVLGLFVSIVAAVCVVAWLRYEPIYEAYNTFVVSSNQSTEADTVLAKRLAVSFDHSFVDSGLKKEIAEEIGAEGGFPAQVTGTVLEDTNFFTITVHAEDGTIAENVLDLISESYESVAKEIVGNVELSSIDATGVLTEPTNSFGIFSTILKGILIAIAVIAVILYAYICNKKTIHSVSDIKKHLDATNIGTVPVMYFKKRKNNAKPLLLITNNKISQTYRESIHTLRIRVEKLMEKEQQKVLLVTSSIPNEGKTTLSVNLAVSIASREKKVLLIDGDLRAPSLHKFFEGENLPKKKSIGELLTDGGNIQEGITHSNVKKLDVILGGERIEDPSSVLAGEALKALLDEARECYDYVIFDSPPAAMLSDSSAVAGIMDAVLFIIRQDYTRIQYAQEGLALLKDSGVPLLGCVMNYAEAGFGGYGYGYYGYRYNKYQYGRYERYYGKEKEQ